MQLELCGAKVDVYESGCGERSVLLLHGWGCSAQLMESVQKALEGNMHVVSLDFPGHGRNLCAPPPPKPWGVPEYMEMVAQLIRKLKLAPCDIVAHSFGARVAILLASTYPELVGRMILTGAAGIRKQADGTSSKKTDTHKKLKKLVEAARKCRIFGSLPDKWQEALIQKYGSKDYAALSPEMRKTFVKVVNYDQAEKLSAIHNSTLLVWGDKDTETPLWMGQQMEREIPDSALIVLNGGTHFAYLEQAARFNAIARSFLVESN